MTSLGIRLLKWLFIRPLTVEESLTLTNFILEKMGALPIKDAIHVEDNQLFVNGTPVDREKEMQLRQSASAALDNQALTLVREQVAYTATVIGVHQAEASAQMFFARAVIWWGQREQKLLETLAKRNIEM